MIITNFEAGKVEMVEIEDNPEADMIPKREMPFNTLLVSASLSAVSVVATSPD